MVVVVNQGHNISFILNKPGVKCWGVIEWLFALIPYGIQASIKLINGFCIYKSKF